MIYAYDWYRFNADFYSFYYFTWFDIELSVFNIFYDFDILSLIFVLVVSYKSSFCCLLLMVRLSLLGLCNELDFFNFLYLLSFLIGSFLLFSIYFSFIAKMINYIDRKIKKSSCIKYSFLIS